MFSWIFLIILIILIIFALIVLIRIHFIKGEKKQISYIEKFNASILIDLNRMIVTTTDDKNVRNNFDFINLFKRLKILDFSKNKSFNSFILLLLNKEQKNRNLIIKNKVKKFINNQYTFFSKSLISEFGYFGVLKISKFDSIKNQITIMSYGYRTKNNNFQNYIHKTKIYKEEKLTDYQIFQNFYEKIKNSKYDYNLSIIKDLTLATTNNLYNKFLSWGLKAFFREYEDVDFYLDNLSNIYFLTRSLNSKNELIINNYYIEKFNLIKYRFQEKMKINFDFSGFEIASSKIIKNEKIMLDYAFCQIQKFFDNNRLNKINNYQEIIKYANQIINYDYSKKDGVNIEVKDNYFVNKSIVIISINFLNKNVEEINNYTVFKKYEMTNIFFKSLLSTIKDKKIKDYLILLSLSTFTNFINYFEKSKIDIHSFLLTNSYDYLVKNELEIKKINWEFFEIYLLQDNFWFSLDTILIIIPKIVFITQNYLDNFENNQIEEENLNEKYLNLLDIKRNYKDIDIKKI